MSDSAKRDMQAERLKAARAAAGFRTPAAAIDKFHWKPSTYMAHENGQNGIRPEPAVEYGKAYGVEPGWLLTGVGKGPETGLQPIPPSATEQIQPLVTIPEVNIYQMPRDVPVYSGAIAGADDLVAFEFNGQILDRARRPERLAGVKDAYALYVLGSSMAPWRKPGELVYVHPHIPANPGDYVVVQLKPESDGGPIPAYIKRLVRRTAAEVRLAQYRPEKEFTLQAKKVWKIHRIMDWSELLGL